ncbi:MAG: hypothetical protein R3B84_20890 [Zavarzinella sp.]
MPNALFRELHRLRKHLHELQSEIDRVPRLLKAHQNKVLKQETLLNDATLKLKKTKAHQLDLESRTKSALATLQKYQDQLDTLSNPKEYKAKETDIQTTRGNIAQLEDETLETMGQIEEQSAQIPPLEEALAKARGELVAYQNDMAERLDRLKQEHAHATKLLSEQEIQLSEEIRPQYARLVKAHGHEALAAVENSVCTQCRTSLTAEKMNQLTRNEVVVCYTCGRIVYV